VKTRSCAAWCTVLGVIGSLFGCAPAPPPPSVLELRIVGSAEQNPSAVGAPSPVAVHLFQLASTAQFDRADVFALIEREKATLGAADLDSGEIVLSPSETKELKQPLKNGTQALGVLVLFRDIDNAQWRASAPVTASGVTSLQLNVGKLSMTLGPVPK
jgi:type VI secretion system protein VasD